MADDRDKKDEAQARFHESMAGEHEAAIAKEVADRLRPLFLMCDYLGWLEVAEHLAVARTELARIMVEARTASASPDRTGSGPWQIH